MTRFPVVDQDPRDNLAQLWMEAKDRRAVTSAADAVDRIQEQGKSGVLRMGSIERQFQWAVQALVQPADVQPTLFPSFVVVADELALDFDNWWKAYESNFGHLCSQQQRQAVASLDHLLTEMSGPGKPELWMDEGCLSHPKWSMVRRLAADVLSARSDGRPPFHRRARRCSVFTKAQPHE